MKRLLNSLKATIALSLLNFLGKRKRLKNKQTPQQKGMCYIDVCVGNIVSRTLFRIPKLKAAGNKDRYLL